MAGFDLDAARVVRMQQDLEALLPHDDEVLRQEILRLLTIGAGQHANLVPLLRDALRSRQKRPTPATSAEIGTDHDDAGLEMEALPTVRRATLWPCRPKRFPGELLSSWLWRTAREQGSPPRRFALDAIGTTLADIDRDIDDAAVARLAFLSGQSELDQLRGTMRADVPIAFFSMHNDPRERAMQALLQHGGLVLNRMRRGRSTPILQYCPVCLAGDRAAYLRRGWYFSLEVVCFNDGCLLMDACWQCGALLDPLSLAAPSPDFRCLACGARLADAPSLRLSEAIADQVMLYCALTCAAVPPGTDCITDQGRDYIDALASGALRGTNPMNAADRLHAVTLEAWHHRVAFARWKARRRRGTRRRKGGSYAAAALS